MKRCHACNELCKTYGKYKEPKIMRVYVLGSEFFLCPTCRHIWGEICLKLARKYCNEIRSKRYISELRKSFDLFCRGTWEKVEFT